MRTNDREDLPMAVELRIASYNILADAYEPDRLPELGDLTPLPSETEPSDHLPIAARLLRG